MLMYIYSLNLMFYRHSDCIMFNANSILKYNKILKMFWLYFFNLLETLEKNEEGNQECTIQRNWQHCVHKTKNTIQKTKK